MSETVYLGLGSNEGDRERQLVSALRALTGIDAVSVLRCSSLYDSAPVGPPQPRYLNAAVALECDLPPLRLLAILQHIEQEAGRKRAERWGPRRLDLDLLLWEGQLVAEPQLQIPHLELHKRRFALEPLCELAPGAVHPVMKSTVKELLARLGPQDVHRLEATQWPGVTPAPEP